VATSKILVIDDSRVIRKTVRDMLPEGDFEIVEAKDGVEGIDKLNSESPSLIMLDFILPKLSGWEVFQQIQSNPDFQKIPLVLMSGKKEEVTDKMSEPFEYFEFIEKPFDRAILADAIRAAMTKARKARPQLVLETVHPEAAPIDLSLVNDLRAQIEEVRDTTQANLQTLQTQIQQLHGVEAPAAAPSAEFQARIEKLEAAMQDRFQGLSDRIDKLQQAPAAAPSNGLSGEDSAALRAQIEEVQQARQVDKEKFASQIEEFLNSQAEERGEFKNKSIELESEIETLKKQLGQLVVLIKKKMG
jgi:DNA-binding response OmpR family regulator